jgi:hypothetical protein
MNIDGMTNEQRDKTDTDTDVYSLVEPENIIYTVGR